MSEPSVPPHPDIRLALLYSLTTPNTWQITALAFGHAGHLYAGSGNGDLRVYDLSTFKAVKAVKGEGTMISSIVCVKRPGSDLRDAWIASGKQILQFRMDTSKMIQGYNDALQNIVAIPSEEDDEVQDLALNSEKTHLAFGTDSGFVGVIDLANKAVMKMKTKHDIMCGSVVWIPERPRELVSGGCDATLLHMDTTREEVLSKQNLAGLSTQDDKISMSPPFIMSLAIASNGILAAGTADGKLWLGFGGEKASSTTNKSKKKGKWGGLDLNRASIVSVAEAPVVAVAFHNPTRLTVSTLKGAITHYNLIYGQDSDAVIHQAVCHCQSENLAKVNALVVDERRIIVGGFDETGKGVIDIWKLDGGN